MPVRRLLSGALTAPLLILAGCGGTSSVADPPVSPSAPVTSTSPPRHESPQAFIRRWADAEKRMENTGNTGAYLAISTHCRPCVKLAREVDGFYRSGGFVKWGGWTIKSIARNHSHGALITFTVRIDSAPTEYKASAAGEIQHLTGGPSTELLTLKRTPSSWMMCNTIEQAS